MSYIPQITRSDYDSLRATVAAADRDRAINAAFSQIANALRNGEPPQVANALKNALVDVDHTANLHGWSTDQVNAYLAKALAQYFETADLTDASTPLGKVLHKYFDADILSAAVALK